MTSSQFKLTELYQPADGLIEKIAGEFAGTWFEAARSSGLEIKGYGNNSKKFAKEQFENFIPHAIKILLDILNNPKTAPDQKFMIYEQILKRTNDLEMRALFPSNVERDKPFDFSLPENFLEKNFPHFVDPDYLKKKLAN